jgi:arsenite methyltransferase
MRRGEYGFDAPSALIVFGAVCILMAVNAGFAFARGEVRAVMRASVISLFFLGNTLSFLYTTRRGKFIEWERILDRAQLQGNERALDMGCGRGAVLTAIARRLTTGSVTGIDIWSTQDQSGNAQQVTERNASLEGVADRVKVQTGDMRALPFPDATFDLVVSSMAIHNISGAGNRRKAVAEGFRVLKPGGRMILADIRATRTYEDELRKLGASDVVRQRLGWRFWWGNPVAATSLVTAFKPR